MEPDRLLLQLLDCDQCTALSAAEPICAATCAPPFNASTMISFAFTIDIDTISSEFRILKSVYFCGRSLHRKMLPARMHSG